MHTSPVFSPHILSSSSLPLPSETSSTLYLFIGRKIHKFFCYNFYLHPKRTIESAENFTILSNEYIDFQCMISICVSLSNVVCSDLVIFIRIFVPNLAIALHSGFGFIQFSREAEAQDAMTSENGAVFQGKVISAFLKEHNFMRS